MTEKAHDNREALAEVETEKMQENFKHLAYNRTKSEKLLP